MSGVRVGTVVAVLVLLASCSGSRHHARRTTTSSTHPATAPGSQRKSVRLAGTSPNGDFDVSISYPALAEPGTTVRLTVVGRKTANFNAYSFAVAVDAPANCRPPHFKPWATVRGAVFRTDLRSLLSFPDVEYLFDPPHEELAVKIPSRCAGPVDFVAVARAPGQVGYAKRFRVAIH
jgi:hypothetical protein